ncbi:Phosphoribosylglycinamide formyltransferase [compost metagenome]
MNSIERAFNDQCTKTGVTLHFVDEGVDTGPAIRQQAVEINPGESLAALAEKMHQTEHRLYTDFLSELVQGR